MYPRCRDPRGHMLFSLARAGRAAGMRRGLHPGMPLVKLAAAHMLLHMHSGPE